MNKCVLLAWCAALACAPLQATASGKHQLVVDFGDKSSVAIDVVGGKVKAQYQDAQHARSNVTVQPELQRAVLKAASMVYLLNDQQSQAIIVISEPSKKVQGTGFCGAGYEDYAVLIEKKKDVVMLKDRYLLQSCLKSITVDATNPDDIRTGLKTDAGDFSITYTHLEDPAKKTTLHVNNGKILDK
jgi:hypothetical protein